MTKALGDFPAGCRVTVEQLCECPRARGRLCALGLTPGTEVEICAGGDGPCRLRVRGTDVVLGQGLASRVQCALLNDEECRDGGCMRFLKKIGRRHKKHCRNW